MKTKLFPLMVLLTMLSSAVVHLQAQSSSIFSVSIRNLSQPNSQPISYEKDTQVQVKPSDELEVTWRFSFTYAELYKGYTKIECASVYLLAQLELGAPDSISPLTIVDDPTCVKVRFKASDYAHLLESHKPGLTSFPADTRTYLKLGDIVVHRADGKKEFVNVPARQQYVGITLK